MTNTLKCHVMAMNMTSGLVQSRLVLLISMVACQKIQHSDNGEILFKMWPSPLSVFIWSQWWGRGFLALRPVEKWTGAFLVANWSLTHLTQCLQCRDNSLYSAVQCRDNSLTSFSGHHSIIRMMHGPRKKWKICFFPQMNDQGKLVIRSYSQFSSR